ncbi:MAG: hypothetical protein M1435_02010, partial [Actinobacteria bacterium]|nr:hypothetical protein [Actinomycetota bacterium]
MVVAVKSLACEVPRRIGVPLSRLYVPDIRDEAIGRGIVAEISGSTIWRWLSQDAIKPWQHRSWIFPRDPDFEVKASRVLELYAGAWEGEPLGEATSSSPLTRRPLSKRGSAVMRPWALRLDVMRASSSSTNGQAR